MAAKKKRKPSSAKKKTTAKKPAKFPVIKAQNKFRLSDNQTYAIGVVVIAFLVILIWYAMSMQLGNPAPAPMAMELVP
ncbi:hypothetical protein ACFLQ2_03970 [archaeon]